MSDEIIENQNIWVDQLKNRKSNKSWWVALLLSIFFGPVGADRFYLGQIGWGALKLITFGGLGVWWLLDIILISTQNLRDENGCLVTK